MNRYCMCCEKPLAVPDEHWNSEATVYCVKCTEVKLIEKQLISDDCCFVNEEYVLILEW